LAGLEALGAQLGIKHRLMMPGFVELEDLPAVYQLSLAVVHPTGVEGFGFGMEVLACGVPFVTSNLPGVVEAVGDAALTVPPGQKEPLAAAVASILQDEELRRRLSKKGLDRAAGFSYKEVAGRLVELYEKLAVQAP
jgi:glycosyltransferase involved in cell wall biosynthesis